MKVTLNETLTHPAIWFICLKVVECMLLHTIYVMLLTHFNAFLQSSDVSSCLSEVQQFCLRRAVTLKSRRMYFSSHTAPILLSK